MSTVFTMKGFHVVPASHARIPSRSSSRWRRSPAWLRIKGRAKVEIRLRPRFRRKTAVQGAAPASTVRDTSTFYNRNAHPTMKLLFSETLEYGFARRRRDEGSHNFWFLIGRRFGGSPGVERTGNTREKLDATEPT